MRTGFHWHRGEPTPGQYNYTYIQKIVDFIDLLNRSDIYVILDMHQDCWSPRFCDAHGIPSEYAKPYNDSRYSNGGTRAYPEPIVKPSYDATGHVQNCNDVGKFIFGWASCYVTYSIGSAAQELYNNENGILDRFGKFWALIVGKVRHYENVIGYELLNEPWLGDVPLNLDELLDIKNPYRNLWFHKEADQTNMAGMYRDLHQYVRAVDNESIIFFEPATGGNFLDALSTGLEIGPGGKEYNDRQAFSYHVYCLIVDQRVNASNFFQWLIQELDIASCNLLNDAMYDVRNEDTKRLGVPGFLTEFGAAGKGPVAEAIINFAAKKMDEFLHGWTYWYLTPEPADDNSTEVRALVRPYPHAVSGTPYKLAFDPDKKTFILNWIQCTKSPCMNAPTEVFTANRYHYPNGFSFSVSDGYTVSHSEDLSMVYILWTGSDTSRTTSASFTMKPK